MAAPVKPFPLQLASISFGEEYFYRLLKDIAGEGVLGAGDLKVSQKAGGANMSVDVAAGEYFVRFDTPEGGLRHGWLGAVSNSGTPGAPNAADGWTSTFVAANPTNPRIDRVVLTVRDSALDAGGAYDAVLRVIQGAATAGATLANLNGAAAVPANSILLANVLVGAGASSIVDANIDSTFGAVRQASKGSLLGGPLSVLADVTLAQAAGSIDIQSIPAHFAALAVIFTGRGDDAALNVTLAARFNNDTGGNFDWQHIQGAGATASAGEGIGVTFMQAGFLASAGAPANATGSCVLFVPGYAGSSLLKSFVGLSALQNTNATGGQVVNSRIGHWRSAAAINRLALFPSAGNFVAGTRAVLLGVG